MKNIEKEITLTKDLEEIGRDAFMDCKKLKKIMFQMRLKYQLLKSALL